jgi:hypothetical protein
VTLSPADAFRRSIAVLSTVIRRLLLWKSDSAAHSARFSSTNDRLKPMPTGSIVDSQSTLGYNFSSRAQASSTLALRATGEHMKSIGLTIFFCAMLASVGPTQAKYKDIDCEQDTCESSHTLHKSQTVEFRGTCGITKLPNTQKCSPNNKNVSCTTTETINLGSGAKYKSCSCTNWSASGNHKMNLKINC